MIAHGHRPAALGIPTMIKSRADARTIMVALRKSLGSIADWDCVRGNLPELREAVPWQARGEGTPSSPRCSAEM